MNQEIYNMDCLEGLKKIKSNSIDSIITDPPYGLGFMGKEWDSLPPSREVFDECFRVLKPGGHLLSFGGTRTYHRMAVAIEDAGFEIRDMIEWVYGSGFPKSLNIGKVTDKFLKTGNASWNGTGDSSNGALGYSKLQHKQDYRPEDYSNRHQNKDEITEEKAKQWEGWGTALKPAHEPICMARKPLAEKTVAENCLKWGTGGINIDESRVVTEDNLNGGAYSKGEYDTKGKTYELGLKRQEGKYQQPPGRFPANLIHDNSEEVIECFPDTKSGGGNKNSKNSKAFFGNMESKEEFDSNYKPNEGNASRFFKSIIYQAKASKSERNKGCEGLEKKAKVFNGQSDKPSDDMKDVEKRFTTQPKANNHPTVKPIALMEYLIKMVTPKGGIVLDPFTGSGTTGVASLQNGYKFIGIEKESDYIPIIEARLRSVKNESKRYRN